LIINKYVKLKNHEYKIENGFLYGKVTATYAVVTRFKEGVEVLIQDVINELKC
jgi:hypothetical protein